jgi:cytochrome c oxidase subunit 2
MLSIACIYAPSFSLLYAMDEYPDSFICIKIVGRQWYWHYELSYDGNNNIAIPKIANYSFDSYSLSDNTLKSKYLYPKIALNQLTNIILLKPLNESNYSILNIIKLLKSNSVINQFNSFKISRLLETSQAILLPTGTVIRALITASDVIHSWAIPSLGVKTDGIPGRLNQVFFTIIKDGIYYGQCSELCGQYHFAMPIVIKTLNWTSYN